MVDVAEEPAREQHECNVERSSPQESDRRSSMLLYDAAHAFENIRRRQHAGQQSHPCGQSGKRVEDAGEAAKSTQESAK